MNVHEASLLTQFCDGNHVLRHVQDFFTDFFHPWAPCFPAPKQLYDVLNQGDLPKNSLGSKGNIQTSLHSQGSDFVGLPLNIHTQL